MNIPLSLRGGVHSLEDAIITLSGPGIALSGIIAGVDLLTGGHAMSGMPWLTMTWAICLLLSLDFQVLALGARAHKVYLSEKRPGRKATEIVLALLIAAAISYVSIQMQSIVAKMNASSLTIEQATAALGIDANALIFERSVLVVVLIFLSGWFRHEDREPVNQANGVNQALTWERLEEWLCMVVQMNQGMLNQVSESLLAQLAMVSAANQDRLNQFGEQITEALERAQMHQPSGGLRLAQEQVSELVNRLAAGQQRQIEMVFSRCIEQVLVHEERPARQTSPRLRAIPSVSSLAQTGSTDVPVKSVCVSQVQDVGATEEGMRVLNYLDRCKAAGAGEPSLSQIEQECSVSRNTAINWRRQWKEWQGLLIASGK
jgi:hypothetical protein